MHRLIAAGIAARERRRHRLLDETRPLRIGVAADHAHQPCLVVALDLARDLEPDLLAGTDGQTVGIAGDGQHAGGSFSGDENR